MEPVIELKNLNKSYGKHRGIIDLSLTVPKGEIFGFLGPNGAGKSTTIRSILGLIHYDSGEAKILGMDAAKDHVKILNDIGYMPSEAMFYPSMKVSEVIRLAADVRKKDCNEEAAKLCRRLQVDTTKKIEELSLGNRKKVSIVCAMQHNPKLFIFDEPTSGLDPLMQEQFFELIQEYVSKGASCFLSTHVLPEVKKYCSEVAIMKEGRLQCVDSVEHLTKTNAKHIKIIIDGVQEEYVYKGDLNELFASFKGHEVQDILIEEPSLDQIFLHYYEDSQKGGRNDESIANS